MSSAVVSTSAARGRPFVFDAETCGDSRPRPSHRAKLDGQDGPPARILPSSVIPASCLEIRPVPEMVSSGIPALDTLTGGLPRGCLTEICGPASSGRTTLLLATLAAATHRGEFCAVVEASDALDPHSAAAAGVDLEGMLWVRCGEAAPTNSAKRKSGIPISRAPFARPVGTSQRSEHSLDQVLRATDLLLESGGFGLIVLDLADLPPQEARRVPLTTWFRFRRAIEQTPTILLAIEHQPIAGSCSSLLLQLEAAERRKNVAHGVSRGSEAGEDKAREGRKMGGSIDLKLDQPAHALLLSGLEIRAELIRSRLDRKPTRSVAFETKTAWAG
ncbi:MAG: hypothetical protein WAN03_17985 [Candidatus Sulfotelmatobacter sp.]